jgi:hypothetical protein
MEVCNEQICIYCFCPRPVCRIGESGEGRSAGPDWMPALHVMDKVLNSGYTHVTKLEADDGRWEGEGLKNGQKMEFHADPKTGVITSEKLDD